MSDRPLLLVSNDDGVDAPGVIALREALATFADVYTVAPQTELNKSADTGSPNPSATRARTLDEIATTPAPASSTIGAWGSLP